MRVNWKLSRNETLFKENFIITLKDQSQEAPGEIAPNIRYNETPQKIQSDFDELTQRLKSEKIESILKSNNFCNSFNFAIDSAYVSLRAKEKNIKVYEYLKLSKPSLIQTSYTVPIMAEDELATYLKKIERFNFIKIKVNKENAISFCVAISKITNKALRIDANEGWESLEDYLDFERAISDLNVEFIEQPFPSDRIDLYKSLKPVSKYLVIADESITNRVDFDQIEDCFHGINVKLMKAGSYGQAISFLKEAKRRNLKTMLGCMIETSLGISCALNLYELVDYFDLDGSLLIKNDPYNLILEENGFIS